MIFKHAASFKIRRYLFISTLENSHSSGKWLTVIKNMKQLDLVAIATMIILILNLFSLKLKHNYYYSFR